MQRPELTFPPLEAETVKDAYGAARVILEYGSGGSTVLASEMPGKVVFSVESDAAWTDNLRAYLRASPATQSMPVMHHVNIGATREWGHPTEFAKWSSFCAYPLAVWRRADFQQPDLVLVDGRFRAACFFATLLNTKGPVRVLFDDYVHRSNYHRVEDFLAPTAIHGHMAEFHIPGPGSFAPSEITRIIEAFFSAA